MKTSKSTLTVARMVLRAARDSLPDHAKAKSPKKFTQPQLMACLVIKEFLQLDYRSTHQLLSEWSDLRGVLGLTKIPHFTTLCAAATRLLRKPKADAILDAVLDLCRRAKILPKRSKRAAIDSTGLGNNGDRHQLKRVTSNLTGCRSPFAYLLKTTCYIGSFCPTTPTH